MSENSHRIAYAFYSVTWKYGQSDSSLLESQSEEVVPEEFRQEMKGKIFCPVCKTPLSRSPSIDSVSANSITAHFKHGSRERYEESKQCPWRIPPTQGFKYSTEEEAKRAIENQNLSIVSGWMQEPPSAIADDEESEEYVRTPVEDENGPETDVPMSRHRGATFQLPSTISSVLSICRNFPENLRKGFYFPNSQQAMMLSDQLFPVDRLRDNLPNNETLFFGRITDYRQLTVRNVIKVASNSVYEVKIYTDRNNDERKRINSGSVGRYILFWAQMQWESENHIAACKVLDWGAYSLLPVQYERFLPRNQINMN